MMPKPSLFAEEKCGNRRSKLGDLLVGLSKHVDFSALADEIDIALPRPSSAKCGRPPYTTELMTKILILQQLYNLADNALEYQLLGRRSLLKAAPTVVVNKPIFDTKKQRNRRIATPRHAPAANTSSAPCATWAESWRVAWEPCVPHSRCTSKLPATTCNGSSI
jgi:hypothetical protein